MASPSGEPSSKDKQKDPINRVVPLSELRDTVAELMKEAAEAQKEVQAKADDPGTSQPGRAAVLSFRDTVAEMTGLCPPARGRPN